MTDQKSTAPQAPFSDEYGLAAAARAGLMVFDSASRGTGRTTRMIERVQDGDGVICPNSDVARHVKRELDRAGKRDVGVFVVEPGSDPLRSVGTRPAGRMYFEHTWMTEHLQVALDRALTDADQLLAAMSKTPDQLKRIREPDYPVGLRKFESWR